MVRKVKRSDLDDLNKQKKETQNYEIIGSDSFDNVQQFIGKNKKIVYGSTGLIIVLCIIFLLMPSKGEVYFSESECATGMKVTYEGTNVKFETDYRDFGDIAPDKDGTENNGIPDCGEPNVDGYTEILPSIHDSTCTVSMIKTNLDGVEDTCNFYFEDAAGYFFNNIYTGDRSYPIFDNIETVTYGAYIPSFNCGEEYWTDYSAEYSFYANCSTSEFGIIESEEPISISKPVVFISENDVEDIKTCSDYDCLLSSTSINFQEDSVYFGRYSSNQKIRWASILPDVTFQVVQYLFDRANNEYKY